MVVRLGGFQEVVDLVGDRGVRAPMISPPQKASGQRGCSAVRVFIVLPSRAGRRFVNDGKDSSLSRLREARDLVAMIDADNFKVDRMCDFSPPEFVGD